MAGDPDGRQELCVATAETVGEALSIGDDDLVAQQMFIDWFASLDTAVQVYLAQYLQYGLMLWQGGLAPQDAALKVYAVCMERRA